jgi:HNH endonuclease
MGAMNRNVYKFDPEESENQNAGGLLGLLRAAMQQQSVQPGADYGAASNGANSDGSSQGGLLARLAALQAERSQSRSFARNGGQEPSDPPDPDFRQLARVPSVSDREGPAPIPNYGSRSPSAVQPAQFLDIFARPPIWFPEELTPLDQLPRGSANGERAGMDFPRNMAKPKTPEEYPPCTYCRKQTGPDDYHRDHNIPKSRGGDGSRENLNPACKHCNLQKRDRTAEEWYDWIKRGGV